MPVYIFRDRAHPCTGFASFHWWLEGMLRSGRASPIMLLERRLNSAAWGSFSVWCTENRSERALLLLICNGSQPLGEVFNRPPKPPFFIPTVVFLKLFPLSLRQSKSRPRRVHQRKKRFPKKNTIFLDSCVFQKISSIKRIPRPYFFCDPPFFIFSETLTLPRCTSRVSAVIWNKVRHSANVLPGLERVSFLFINL